jgi:AcrR family transcriptional regulator
MDDSRSPEGLRERKRRATENAIEEAAVALALRVGPAAATVEAICRDAGVSRSTFFNYFPSKEQAIFGRAVELAPDAASEAILDAHATELAVGVFHVGLHVLGSRRVNTEVARARVALVAADPSLAHHHAAALAKLEAGLVALLADWLARHPDAQRLPGDPLVEATLTVAAATGAGRLMMAEFLGGAGDVAIDEGRFRSALAAMSLVAGGGPTGAPPG